MFLNKIYNHIMHLAQNLHQIACVRLKLCMHLIFTVLENLFQCITLEISSLALLDEVCVELEDGQNVEE